MDLTTRTEAAYELLPEVRHRPTRPGWRQRLATWLLALVSLSLVLGAAGGVAYHHWWTVQMGPRADAPAAYVTPSQKSTWVQAASTAENGVPGLGAAPVVLSYHDIDDGRSPSKYVVSARSFARQMRMLKLAGYHTLTQDQFVAYLRGDYVPAPRSAVITFDDGTRGLYTRADAILRRHGFHGISFLISGVVGTKAPYYLTWPQVRWMQRSGRWSFAGHTHDTHSQHSDATGRTVQSALTSPLTTASGTETFSDFERRLEKDQRLAFQDFRAHGLPKPRLFAWPFSEVQPEGPHTRYADFARTLMNTRYAATLVNGAAPAAAGRARDRNLPIERLEVVEGMAPDALFSELRQMQSLPLSLLRPAASDTWIQPWDSILAPMGTRGGLHPVATSSSTVPMHWRPQQTDDWTDYRVSAVLHGLGDSRVGIRARVGSVDQFQVSAVRGSARIERLNGLVVDPQPVGTDHDVPGRGSMRVTIEIRQDSTVVSFDQRRFVFPIRPGEDITGGIGLYFSRSAGHPWPRVRDLRVAPL